MSKLPKDKIEVTKEEVFIVKSKHFNACISEDFYKQNPKVPIMMSVECNEDRERMFSQWYENKDQALEDFRNFIAHQKIHNEYDEYNEERTLH